MTIGAYLGWEIATRLPSSFGAPALITLAIVGATLGGAVAAGITELVLIRPLYGKPISQILVTIGLDLAAVGLLMGGFGSTALQIPVPLWLIEPTRIGSMFLPNANFLALGAGVVVLVALEWFLARTRYGIIIRAGVENREMVRALGIDVGRAFTLVFVIGGAMAGLAGILYAVVFSGDLISPTQGDSLLIFAFIVVVIGGLGSIRGSAVAALVVGLLQDYTSFYIGGHSGWAQIGNLSTVLLLAVVLEWRPRGLFGRVV
jgi:branched-chain amino acid transport system permease protein